MVKLSDLKEEELNDLKDIVLQDSLEVDDELKVKKKATFEEDLDVAGDSSLSGTLDVDDNVTMNEDLRVYGSTKIDGTLDILDNTTLEKELSVTEKTTLEDELEVKKASSFRDDVSIDGITSLGSDLNVDGKATLNDEVDIEKATTLKDVLSVDGATTLKSTVEVDDKFTGKEDSEFEKSLKIHSSSDNNTEIINNLVRLKNSNGDYSQLNQIDDDQILELSLKDSDGNTLSVMYLKNDLTQINNNLDVKKSVHVNTQDENINLSLNKNSIDAHCKNYYMTFNKYDGEDDKRGEITIRDNDDNVLNKIVIDDVNTFFDKNIVSKGDISTDGSGVYVKKDDDNQIDIQVNEIKLWAKRSDDDKKTYMYLNQTDDSSGSDICFRDKDDNNLASIRLTDNLITMENHTNIKADLTIQDGNDNSMILHDNEIKLKAKNYYFYVNKDDGDKANCRLEVRDNDDSVKSSIVMGTGSTDISNAVKIMDNKLTINSGSDYYTEINENDVTFGAGDDGGKAVFTKTNASTDCRLENQDKDGNVLSKIKFQGNYVEVGNSGNNLHLSTTSYRFDKLHGSDTKIKADSDLDKGWYSIATFSKNKGRGMARFMILDVKSSHHQVIDFGVTHMYGVDGSNNISVFQQAYYNKQVVNKIRIKEKDTYDGAVVQILISNDADGENDLSVFYLGHNPYEDGWKLKNFIPDDTDPGDVDHYDDMTEKVRVNMTNQKSGSFYGRDIYFRDGKGVAFMNDTDSGVNVAIHAEGEHLYIREPEDSNKEWLRIQDDKEMYVFGSLVHRSANRVYCSVYSDHTSIETDQKYPFNKVDVDNTGSWDTDNYEFVCPRDGDYKVTWGGFIGSSSSDIYRYFVRKNGDKIHDSHVRQIGNDHDNYASSGFKVIIISCDAGDKIDIYFQSDNDEKDHGGTSYNSLAIELMN